MYYAIGDVHGEISFLKELYAKILNHIDEIDDPFGVTIVFLGDYIDRGEDSKAVLDFIINLKNTDNITHKFLMGNHEDLMIAARELDFGMTHMWLNNGGRTTLNDFGLTMGDVQKGALDKYIEWMKCNCVNYIETPDYVFCHGGLDVRTPLDETKAEVFLWKRTHYLGTYSHYDKIVVHGHTPLDDGKPSQGMNEINVDTGCVFTKKLTAVILPCHYDGTIYRQKALRGEDVPEYQTEFDMIAT